jgi:radical SAM superfamily enzyme YgiQ (UPF0313 family)
MKALLLNPKYPDTFWSLKHALKFISKKAAYPPLGLITIAAMLPKDWEKRLNDLNTSPLNEESIRWADIVFIGAMSVQSESVFEIISRCKSLRKKIVAGGPLFTEEFERFPEVDHLVLNEAEITLPLFLHDYMEGKAERIYQTHEFADLSLTPVPDISLIRHSHYASMSIQFSRGCPFNCEFCDITALLGHKTRTKSTEQIISELENLRSIGWEGNVFFVDDNFIGNKNILKNDLLPAIAKWMKMNRYPFVFTTEASINLSNDEELMRLMVESGFVKVFVGIETPDEQSLSECNKTQNQHRDLLGSVKAIQKAGMEVAAGFIVGFDNDNPGIFQRQIDFIQSSGIISAMVGLLNAPRKTQLYRRLEKEGRILSDFTGDQTSYNMNFIPKMDSKVLLDGYQKIIHGIYSSKMFYKRVLAFLKSYKPPTFYKNTITLANLISLIKSVFIIGIMGKKRRYYWYLLLWSLFRKPEVFSLAVTYNIQGYHFRKIFRSIS